MDKLMQILKSVRADVDFFHEKALIDDGILDSFNTMEIVSKIEDEFGVEIDPDDLVAENFNSADAINKLIERLK
jgi:acyl carrier protein